MKKILEVLGAGVVGVLGCAVYLVFAVIGSIVTLLFVTTLFNLIF